MVKKLGQRKFLLKAGYTEEELDRMSSSKTHSLISDMETTSRKRREKEACISQLKDCDEMTKEIFNTCAWRFGNPYDHIEIFKDIAEDLTNLGYRKFQENLVILNQEEYEGLKNQITELEEQRDRQAYIAEDLIQDKHRWTEQARKEAATKFTGRMIKLMYEAGDFTLYYKVKEAAKEFGVEVEE